MVLDVHQRATLLEEAGYAHNGTQSYLDPAIRWLGFIDPATGQPSVGWWL
jgi:hypothetical protein